MLKKGYYATYGKCIKRKYKSQHSRGFMHFIGFYQFSVEKNGKQIEIVAEAESSLFPPRIGKTYKIWVHGANPYQIVRDSERTLMLKVVMFYMLGIPTISILLLVLPSLFK